MKKIYFFYFNLFFSFSLYITLKENFFLNNDNLTLYNSCDLNILLQQNNGIKSLEFQLNSDLLINETIFVNDIDLKFMYVKAILVFLLPKRIT